MVWKGDMDEKTERAPWAWADWQGDTILVFMIPVLTYLLALAFNWGSCIAFKIPGALIRLGQFELLEALFPLSLAGVLIPPLRAWMERRSGGGHQWWGGP